MGNYFLGTQYSSPEMSLPCFLWISLTQWSRIRLSKSSPPRWVSPAIAFTYGLFIGF